MQHNLVRQFSEISMFEIKMICWNIYVVFTLQNLLFKDDSRKRTDLSILCFLLHKKINDGRFPTSLQVGWSKVELSWMPYGHCHCHLLHPLRHEVLPLLHFPWWKSSFWKHQENQFSSTKPRKKWIIPAHGSSRYVKFLLFGRVLLVNRHNFYTWKIQVYLSHFSNTVVPYCWLPRFMFDCCTNGDSQVVSIDLNHVCLIARVNLIKVGGMIFWPPPISTQRKTHDCMTKGAILRKDKSNPRLSNWIT